MSNKPEPTGGNAEEKFEWPKIERLKAIDDPAEFKKNYSSEKARQILSKSCDFHYELWIDQHYQTRQQFGDKNGKRDGIEQEVVKSLVIRAFQPLIIYSTLVKEFKFINKGDKPPVMVVLQEEIDGIMLNVPIQAHLCHDNKFEITVKTAMRINDFKIQAGQYVIELQAGGSVLKKFHNGQLKDVFSL